MEHNRIEKAAELIKESAYTVAFTGAGISVESGIPPFRGEGGLWSTYDPQILNLETYLNSPEESWPAIKKLFYDFFGEARPNSAHFALAEMERLGMLNEIITQNIDHLHQLAGSRRVHEFHGRSNYFVCTRCKRYYKSSEIILEEQPPRCLSTTCKSLLKPDFVFFGEGIPQPAYEASLLAVQNAKVLIIIGTSGEIMPASNLPNIAKQAGSAIIEINPNKSRFTLSISDVFIQAKASEGLNAVLEALKSL
jgi:NAD-dependent deacetylase